MKKGLLFALLLAFSIGTMAQLAKTASKYEKRIPRYTVDNPVLGPVQHINPTVISKSALDEDDLGTTRYDLQTNEAIQERLYLHEDGTMSAIWTMGQLDATSFPDRGTGYNYFDGTAWGTAPSARIETSRTGWPSINPWNGNGEVVFAHNSTTSLVMNSRPVKGTGTWTQKLAPSSPSGAPGLAWPRAITSGSNFQNIHILCPSLPSGNGGAVYNGLDGALLYWRSTDGGTTWDKVGVQLPGLTSDNYDSFGGDQYAWGTPKGDTIYFCVGGPYTDTFIMVSYDNGTTWTKIDILSNGYKKIASTVTDLPPWRSSDGSVACEMDPDGVIHFASGIGGGSMEGGEKYIRLYNNGLIYWNTTMEMLPDSLDLDTLYSRGQLAAWYEDGPNPGDTLNTLTSYRVGLCSHPQISIDDMGNICLLFGQYTWANPEPSTGINFHHVYGKAWFHDKATWSQDNAIDLQEGVNYIFTEYAYPAMAKRIMNDQMEYIVQTSPSPGTAVGTAGTTGALAYRTDNTYHFTVPFSKFWPVSVPNTQAKQDYVGQIFPNPVSGIAKFNVSINKASNIVIDVINITGQTVMSLNKGMVLAGSHQFSIDASNLNEGVYFYTVKINGQSYTHKMIVE